MLMITMSKDKINNSISTLNAVIMCVLIHSAYLIEKKKETRERLLLSFLAEREGLNTPHIVR